ncbi:DUF2971 domain-containing protein [Acinetobacter sp. SA01]|uniref:DUF2971 domain-containing protein n=1 Tax=Acinetobacter sp. SA01 TaxID=1862567 RepID=UPI00140B5563|nr:DUF2971 domain-containing protein [Acinetobacter sp. SA01]
MNIEHGLHQNGISIYRFEPDNCTRIKQLEEGKLYISDPKEFNDPFDFHLDIKDLSDRTFEMDDFQKIIDFIYKNKLIYKYYILNKNIEKNIEEIFSQNRFTPDSLPKLCSMIKNHILTFGVQCFSLDCNIPLQWAHYSKSHKGFCIEYNLRKMDLVSQNNGYAIYDVSYINKLPSICISEALLTPHQAIGKLLATKTVDWAYEQEIRIINFEKQSQSVDMPKGLSIKSLIAGVNMIDDHLTLLKQVGEKLGVPVYQMKKGQNESDPLWSREKL